MQVGRAVFNEAILGAMRGKTRLLATNQLQYARQADIAVLMSVRQLLFLRCNSCSLGSKSVQAGSQPRWLQLALPRAAG